MSRRLTAATALLLLVLTVVGDSAPTSGEERKDAPKPPPVIRATDSAKQILAKALEAYGGEKNIDRWAVGKIRYRTSGALLAGIPGGKGIVVEDTFQYPERLKRVATS